MVMVSVAGLVDAGVHLGEALARVDVSDWVSPSAICDDGPLRGSIPLETVRQRTYQLIRESTRCDR